MEALTWGEIAERLSSAHSYWLHTTGEEGTPHASPVWGVVVNEVLYHYTESRTRKAQDLLRNARVVVHLESASEVLIVHGELRVEGHPRDHLEILRALDEKYGRPDEVPFLPSRDPCFDVLYALEPSRALTWSLPDTEASTRRWLGRAT